MFICFSDFFTISSFHFFSPLFLTYYTFFSLQYDTSSATHRILYIDQTKSHAFLYSQLVITDSSGKLSMIIVIDSIITHFYCMTITITIPKTSSISITGLPSCNQSIALHNRFCLSHRHPSPAPQALCRPLR